MRVLGIDIGKRRIGLAISDASATLARPWQTIALSRAEEALRVLVDVVTELRAQEEGLETIVIGLPRRLDGSPSDLTAPTLALADALRRVTGVAVALQDERLSSREAESRLAVRQKDWRERKKRLDAAAAAVILQDYLDEMKRSL